MNLVGDNLGYSGTDKLESPHLKFMIKSVMMQILLNTMVNTYKELQAEKPGANIEPKLAIEHLTAKIDGIFTKHMIADGKREKIEGLLKQAAEVEKKEKAFATKAKELSGKPEELSDLKNEMADVAKEKARIKKSYLKCSRGFRTN